MGWSIIDKKQREVGKIGGLVEKHTQDFHTTQLSCRKRSSTHRLRRTKIKNIYHKHNKLTLIFSG
ncbi:hypothetical protein Hdeb2414_s0009g00304491 [Helianthus debilis subsp. tardiflorus]